MEDYLPEELVVRILERLPIKSLIRFTCVSKRWRFIILRDPEFAKSHFQLASQQQNCSRRILIPIASVSEFKSLEVHALSSPSPLKPRKVRCPLTQPGGRYVTLACSCNGLIFAALSLREANMYIWNPSTQVFRKLPNPLYLPSETQSLSLDQYGFGYVSATDEYKVIVNFIDEICDEVDEEEEQPKLMHIFSSKSNIWKTTRVQVHLSSKLDPVGILLNEALYWVNDNPGILAFDLATEEFRKLPLPIPDGDFRYLKASGDYLYAFDFAVFDSDGSIDLWVMKNYDVADSWTKLFNLEVSDQPERINFCVPILVLESSIFLLKFVRGMRLVLEVIRSGLMKEELETQVMQINAPYMQIEYQESLLWLG